MDVLEEMGKTVLEDCLTLNFGCNYKVDNQLICTKVKLYFSRKDELQSYSRYERPILMRQMQIICTMVHGMYTRA